MPLYGLKVRLAIPQYIVVGNNADLMNRDTRLSSKQSLLRPIKVRRKKIPISIIFGTVNFSVPLNLSHWIIILEFQSTSIAILRSFRKVVF